MHLIESKIPQAGELLYNIKGIQHWIPPLSPYLEYSAKKKKT